MYASIKSWSNGEQQQDPTSTRGDINDNAYETDYVRHSLKGGAAEQAGCKAAYSCAAKVDSLNTMQ